MEEEEDPVPKDAKEKGAGEAAVVEGAEKGAEKEKELDLGAEGSEGVEVVVDSERTEVMKEPAEDLLGVVEDPMDDELPKAGVAALTSPVWGAPNEKPPVAAGLGDEVLADALDPPNENPPEGLDPGEVEGKVEKGVEPVEAAAGASSLAPPNENPPDPNLGFSTTTDTSFPFSSTTSPS